MSTINNFINDLLQDGQMAGQIACHRELPAAAAKLAEPLRPLPRAIANLLGLRNISLYSHQALALNHIRAGKHVVVSTPTASGKSLIYNLPVLEKFLLDRDSTAIYLSPLKALARDQLASFNKLISPWPETSRPLAALYDGDTPDAERKAIRETPPSLLLTNPDMLHYGILPFHEKWTSFLAGLATIIVDEAHIYRGLFGSHMALVFRRLNRVVERYGNRPQYIFCTATLGNPAELCAALMGGEASPPVSVAETGAPAGKRHFLFIDPLLSASTCAINLLKTAVAHNLRTIVYCRSRKITELISIWAQDSGEIPKNSISAYRAGFLPEEHREIEKKMSEGSLKAVISTSALELGIDIGGLDLCILVGYPGSIMQTFQRGGRVGRAGQDSAVILVAGEDALDQFFIKNPEQLFSRPPEKAVINPHNEHLLARHLECAAAESPIQAHERLLQDPVIIATLTRLEGQGALVRGANGQWVAVNASPHRDLDLRSSGSPFAIENENGAIIGSIDSLRAWKEAHPGAIYLHHGRSFLVESLDAGSRRIIAREAKTSWFTRVRGHKSTDILEELERVSLGNCVVCRGRLRVSEFITGYEKRATQGQNLLSVIPLEAPPRIFETSGFWLVIPDPIRQEMENQFVHFMGAIHAVEHAIIGLLPLEVMADRNDLGGISIPLHPQLGLPAVFVYDDMPGGAGLCDAAFEKIGDLLAATLAAIQACPCEDGCPSCIHSPKCGAGNRPLSKDGAIKLLEALLQPGEYGADTAKNLKISPPPERLPPEAPAQPVPKPGNTPLKPRAVKPKPAEKPEVEAFFARLATGFSTPGNATRQAPQRFVVFDVETRKSAREVGGWQNASRMGVSVVSLYERETDKIYSFEQDELELFFQKLARADLVIGFNSFRFDYEVLAPFAAISVTVPNLCLRALPGLDLLQAVVSASGTRISLDNLCQATLRSSKSANGLQALKWWQQGEIEKIKKYCEKDVELTRDLYLAGLASGEVFYTSKAGSKVRLSVDFRSH